MKKKEVAIVIGCAVVASIFSYVIFQFLFGGEKSQTLTAPEVKAISSTFETPDKKFVNPQSINPTVIITVEGSNNGTPIQTEQNN